MEGAYFAQVQNLGCICALRTHRLNEPLALLLLLTPACPITAAPSSLRRLTEGHSSRPSVGTTFITYTFGLIRVRAHFSLSPAHLVDIILLA